MNRYSLHKPRPWIAYLQCGKIIREGQWIRKSVRTIWNDRLPNELQVIELTLTGIPLGFRCKTRNGLEGNYLESVIGENYE